MKPDGSRESLGTARRVGVLQADASRQSLRSSSRSSLWNSDREDSAEDSELLEAPSGANMTSLVLGTSVYDDAFLAPLLGSLGGRAERATPWRQSIVLCGLSFLLQSVTLYKLAGTNGLVSQAREYMDKMQWTEGEAQVDGVCHPSDIVFPNSDWSRPSDLHMIGEPPPRTDRKYVSCMSTDIFALDWAYLDENRDGLWSQAGAQEMQKATLEGVVFQTGVMHRKMKQALNSYAKIVVASNLSLDAHRQAHFVIRRLRESNGSIPKDVWDTQIAPFFKMCSISDPELCGNIVFRESVTEPEFMEPLARAGFSSPPLGYLAWDFVGGGELAGMMHACDIAVRKVCPSFLTSIHQRVADVRKQICGAAEPLALQTNPDRYKNGEIRGRLVVVEYDSWVSHHETVLSTTYMSFLALILLLWVVSMLEDFRIIATWWLLLKRRILDSRDDWGASSDCVVCTEDSIEVSSVPRSFAFVYFVLNVVPRSCVWLGTCFIGSDFLSVASSYADLIMNSLALTFIITIDDMLFVAFVPTVRRAWIDRCKPIDVPIPWSWKVLCQEVVLVLLVMLGVGAGLAHAYWAPSHGKFAEANYFRCLCQVAGRDCFDAWRLGGYPEVRANPNFVSV